MSSVRRSLALAIPTGFTCTFAISLAQQPEQAAGLPPARPIPGITAEDEYPRACVDCHIDYADMGMDARISTLLAQWLTNVPPQLLEAAQAVAAPGVRLSGIHPPVDFALRDIPGACMTCHGSNSVVPLVPLLHRVHLSDEGDAVYLRTFQGECTHCHKLDPSTGRWRVPSAPERE